MPGRGGRKAHLEWNDLKVGGCIFYVWAYGLAQFPEPTEIAKIVVGNFEGAVNAFPGDIFDQMVIGNAHALAILRPDLNPMFETLVKLQHLL